MAKERRSRFANPVVVLADPDSAARYGLWIESLLVSLVDEGLNPVLLTPPGTPLADSIPENAIARLTCPGGRIAAFRRWGSRWLLEQLGGEPIRLVLALSGAQTRYGGWLAGRLNVPLATVVMGEEDIGPAVGEAGRLASAFAGSAALADRLADRLGGRGDDRVHQVSLGVHLGQGPAAAFRSGERAWGLLAAGPLDAGNNFDSVIAAFAHLNERGYEAAYFIIGSGPAERRLRRLAAEKKLTERLTFVPELRRPENIYAGIDVFIQPFVCRRLDLRVLEAMAAGTVVLARNGGALDTLRDGVNGVELGHGDEAELTLLLGRLLDEPELGRRLGASARQFIQANHLAGVTAGALVGRVREIALAQQTIKLKPAEQVSSTGVP